MAQRDSVIPIGPGAVVIGAAMALAGGHLTGELRADGERVREPKDSAYPTHVGNRDELDQLRERASVPAVLDGVLDGALECIGHPVVVEIRRVDARLAAHTRRQLGVAEE